MDPEGGLPDGIEESYQVAYGSFRTTHQSSGVRHLVRRKGRDLQSTPTHIPSTRSGYGNVRKYFVLLFVFIVL
ncbi:hypothetical protein MCOR02_002238 [Pyricularia oryzae]|uniref:Uncharacterized protein n=1 Tax=Pyricularia oryzae (strain Y34) TaxID=1143189 RepID=A0AA97NW66_PYRO3|nr:hypothetical protein OOU_Y34scaffold00590g38 [Pyricularia oryzae Y34]KAH9438623.1 hypothetical protein MCOR02_002238 [Pyricularia oryzae]KAI6434887.1 hypothetical protein MCOR21_001981 [Pyricularia oryzae]KAI6557478.1 hypothetical protein MCOR04_010106 [Pyricularia oryzae]